MDTPASFDELLKQHYPRAVTQAEFRDKVRHTLAHGHGLDNAKMLLATSVCADDVIAVREEETPSLKGKFKKDFLGPFSMGGLAGLPYSGLTGITAICHHIPDGGALLLAYGPHIGITDKGVLGKLHRPGQGHESAACGALTLAVEHLRASPDKIGVYDDDDMEQTTLERRLAPFRDEILAAENPLKTATDVAYRIIHGLIRRYVAARKPEFHCQHIALAGGVIINTSPDRHDYIDLRNLEVLKVADL